MATRWIAFVLLCAVHRTAHGACRPSVELANTRPGRVKLVRNGYEGVLIAIHNNVIEREHTHLVETIKRVFTDASSYMYKATRRRAFFRKITILVPQSWSSASLTKDENGTPLDSGALFGAAFSYSTANLRVKASATKDLRQHRARTLNVVPECGKHHPDSYMEMTTFRLTENYTQVCHAGRLCNVESVMITRVSSYRDWLL